MNAEPSRSPGTPEAVLALQRRVGNRAVRAYLSGRGLRQLQRAEQTLQVDAGQTVRYEDSLVDKGEVLRVWQSLKGMGARIDPGTAASVYAAGKREEAERPTPPIPRPPVNVESLSLVKPVSEWKYAELAGLERALQVGGSIPALATRSPAAVVFGKVTALIDLKKRMVDPGGGKKKYVEQYAELAGGLEQAETVTPVKGAMSIVLAAGCTEVWPPQATDGTLMDVVAGAGADSARAQHEFLIRMMRMTWIHEFGHTLYPRYKAEWEKLVTDAVKAREGSPTTYAARKTSVEEDFCESFTVLALYPEFKHVLGPTRTTFFGRHPELVRKGESSPSTAVRPAVAGKV